MLQPPVIAALQSLLVITLLSSVVGLLIVIIAEWSRLSSPDVRRGLYSLCILLVALGVLGGAAGLAGGQSRVGVVGSIYNTAFVFMGVAATYLFGINRQQGGAVAVCSIVFALSLFTGFQHGAGIRNLSEEQRELRTACLKALTDGDFAKEAAAFDRFWAAMQITKQGIAADFNWPIASGDTKFTATMNLCGQFVKQWDIPPSHYVWPQTEAVVSQ